MNCIEVLVNEHKNIARMLEVIRKISYKVLAENEINYDDFYLIIDFIREYADNYHHGKEEKILFNRMVEELGPIGHKLINNGMLVEHDMGRFHVKELENALEKSKNGDDEARLDIIANAIGYASLLARHKDKEDKVVYTYAEKNLSPEILSKINDQCYAFESLEENKINCEKYVNILKVLEAKYIK